MVQGKDKDTRMGRLNTDDREIAYVRMTDGLDEDAGEASNRMKDHELDSGEVMMKAGRSSG